jgi:hypothetical protein
MKIKTGKNFEDVLVQDELITDFNFNQLLHDEQLEISINRFKKRKNWHVLTK